MTKLDNHFFVIGAQRSGTTYLYHVLNSHPTIQMSVPVKPEPKFFLRENLDGFSMADYIAMHFPDKSTSGAQIFGEKSTTYLESSQIAAKIKQWFPNTKILIMLREPISRAVSNYYFSKNNSLETLPMQEAFLNEEERRDQYDKTRISASPFAYLQRGQYIHYLQQWEQHFPREQMIIKIYEEFVGSLDAVQTLYAELGQPAGYVPDSLDRSVNASNEHPHDAFPANLKDYLLDYFAESNQALEQWLGRSIPAWRDPL